MAGSRIAPGLDGFIAAEQMGMQRGMNDISKLSGLLNLQAMMEQQQLAPLRRQQLQLSIDRAVQNAELLKRATGGQGPAPMAFGEGGVSLPGGGQGNVNTGQVIPPQQPQRGGIPQNIQAMLLSGDPGMQAYAKAVLEQNKPIAAREGAPVINPATGEILFYAPKLESGMLPNYEGGRVTGVQNIPGFVPAMTERTRGQEGVRAEYDLVDVPVSGGGSRRMSRMDALNALGSGRPPAEQQALQTVMDAERQGRPASVTVPGTLGVTNPKSDETYSGERAKFYAERAGKLNDSWYTANEIHSKLDLLQNLFQNPSVASGGLAEGISDLKGLADSFGIQTTGKSSEDVIRAVTNEMAMRIKNAGGTNMMPGAMSDFEQKLLRSMVPNLAQSREGRMLMTEVMRAKVLQDMKISEIAASYEEKNGKLDSGFEREARQYLRANPMFDEQKAGAMLELAKRLGARR